MKNFEVYIYVKYAVIILLHIVRKMMLLLAVYSLACKSKHILLQIYN